MKGYEVTIKECSRELTARERIMFKDTSNAIKLDVAASDPANAITGVVITPVDYAVLSIHNDKLKDNKDYENYVLIDKDGTKYVTGSPSFWSAFSEIADEMSGESEEWSISVYKLDSKNYKDKQFLTCSII